MKTRQQRIVCFWDESGFVCALAGQHISVKWADQKLATSIAEFGAQQVGPGHENAEVVLAEPLDGSTTLTNTNAAGNILLVGWSRSARSSGVPIVELDRRPVRPHPGQLAMNAKAVGPIAVIIYNTQGRQNLLFFGLNHNHGFFSRRENLVQPKPCVHAACFRPYRQLR